MQKSPQLLPWTNSAGEDSSLWVMLKYVKLCRIMSNYVELFWISLNYVHVQCFIFSTDCGRLRSQSQSLSNAVRWPTVSLCRRDHGDRHSGATREIRTTVAQRAKVVRVATKENAKSAEAPSLRWVGQLAAQCQPGKILSILRRQTNPIRTISSYRKTSCQSCNL